METYRIHFKDGTSTLLTILEDDNLQDVIVELCEFEGWNVQDVVRVERAS